ncbi:MAG: response regulator, partial [Opitutaceae bacterium]
MKTVLIVDDNSQNLYFLELLLKGNSFKVVSASTGEEALAFAHKEAPDLIVSDILMPVMDGWTLCRKWKSDPQLQNIPFVFYTATYTEPKDEAFAMKLGADRFVTKPQEPAALMEIVNELLKEPKGASQPHPSRDSDLKTEYSEALFRKLQKKVADL